MGCRASEALRESADGAAGRIVEDRESNSKPTRNGYSNEEKLLFPFMKTEFQCQVAAVAALSLRPLSEQWGGQRKRLTGIHKEVIVWLAY